MLLSSFDTTCPYCGEAITLFVDASAGDQTYIEDCTVCCRPITVIVGIDDEGEADVRVQSESDT